MEEVERTAGWREMFKKVNGINKKAGRRTEF